MTVMIKWIVYSMPLFVISLSISQTANHNPSKININLRSVLKAKRINSLHPDNCSPAPAHSLHSI